MTNIHVLLGSTGAGKTRAALQIARATAPRRTILVVPTALQREQLLRAHPLLAPRGSRLHAGPRVLQFYGLVGLLLRRGGMNAERLDTRARLLLLQRLLQAAADAGELPLLGPIAGRSGLIAAIGDLLLALQDADASPAALAAAEQLPYDREIALIYRRYLEAQQQLGVADSVRRTALARDLLRNGALTRPICELLLIDGFDQFTPLQLDLLQALAEQTPQLLITLSHAPQQPALQRFERTREQLRTQLQPHFRGLPDAQQSSELPAELLQLRRGLFAFPALPPIPAGDAIRLIEAPDPEREVRAVLREIRRLLQAGVHARSIALLYRDGTRYTALLREVASEYQLALRLFEGRQLLEARAVQVRLSALRLALADFPRRELVDLLRALDLSAAAGLDRLARRLGIAGGLQQWRSALQALARQTPAGPEDEAAALDPTQASALLAQLNALAQRCQAAEFASSSAFVEWLRQEQGPWAGLPTQNSAVQRLEQLLDELASADALLGAPPRSYAAFVAELERAVATARFERQPPGAGGVAVLPLLAARGSSYDHVFLLGASDGELPRQLPEPLLYGRAERTALQARGINLAQPRPEDEAALFYESVARARRSLTISRTRLDESGNQLPASPYLNALRRLFREPLPLLHISAGSPPALDQAASHAELMIAAAAALADPVAGPAERSRPPWRGRPAWLPADQRSDAQLLRDSLQQLEQQPGWQLVRHAAAVEAQRESQAAPGAYEGRPGQLAPLDLLQQRFGASHVWNATQINDYSTCPFRFAAAHVLQLEPRENPEDGTLDQLIAAQRGRISHAILAEAGRAWRRRGLPANQDTAQQLLAELEQAAGTVFAELERRFGIKPDPYTQSSYDELRRMLSRAIQRLLRHGDGWEQFVPAAVEASFGGNGRPALQLATPAGLLQIGGRIDRIDQRADGALAIIDYKSSGTPRPLRDSLEGRDVQLTVYLLAAEQLLPLGATQLVERAAYFHLRSGELSRPLTAEQREIAINALQQRAAAAANGARSGDFAVWPVHGCPPDCAFDPICRKNLRKLTTMAPSAPQHEPESA